MSAKMNLHIKLLQGRNNHHIAETCYKGLARALRADKMTLAALQQTALVYLSGDASGMNKKRFLETFTRDREPTLGYRTRRQFAEHLQ